METILISGVIAKRLKEEAKKHNLSIKEYLLELLTQNLDPQNKAKEYMKASEELLAEARKELEKDNVRQAAEKVWGAAALAVKAYAYWKNGKRLTSHGQLWEYKRKIESELGEWAGDAWARAVEMHVCFYENWCNKDDVEKALKSIKKLVKTIAQKIL